MPRRKPSKYPLGLWHVVQSLIARRDLVVWGDDLIWFHDPADVITKELGQLLREWKVELVRLVQKDAAKARAARGGD